MTAEYPSVKHLAQLQEHLASYYPNILPEKIKLKRRNAIVRDYDFALKKKPTLYDLQWEARVLIAPITYSHLLGRCEIVVPHLRSEYEALSIALQAVRDRMKQLKQHQELTAAMKPLDALLRKDLSSVFMKDLKHLSYVHGVKI